MKFIYSFFITLALAFGCITDAEARTTVTTVVQKVCTVERQYVPTHRDHHGHLISGHYRNVNVCRNVPRTIVRRTHSKHHHHHHHHKHGIRFAIRL
jgi:hypothetical protein